MKNETMLTILKDYAMLTLNNENGSSVQVRLTNDQLDYIEKTIKLNREINQIMELLKD